MTRNIRLGTFILFGAVILILALFAIGNRTFLFSNTMNVRARFTRVAGLNPGASVQYQGINVGRVASVKLPGSPSEPVVVTMAIAQRAAHLIRTNTQAQIKSDGLVGDQIIVLAASAETADQVLENDFLVGIDPFDLFEISDKAIASVRGFEQVARSFEQIMLDIQKGEGTLGRIVYDPTLYEEMVATANETRRAMNSLAVSGEATADLLVGVAERATTGLESVLQKVESGDGTVAKFLNDPGIYDAFLASADTLRLIATELQAVTGHAENAASWGALGSYRFAELMEAAKHNWLFKRYFEERGHVEQAPFEVRERAISESYQSMEGREAELLLWESRLTSMQARLDSLERALAGPPDDQDQ
ncbi:MAG: phospholipid/cholesterol/gamma-HCH transport system substrate-binding protein [Rhodothermales bacterium]|jgi:phospholipid/cholesterol/gamma-HCH transport system substrate-binding protein